MPVSARSATPSRGRLRESALVLAFAVFALLWLIVAPYRRVYVPRADDVTALADGLLLLPNARSTDWFTRGHSHFFEPYPEWPFDLTPFARPAFQLLIYFAHFIFGKEGASYLAINYLCIAGVVAVAFALARAALGLGVGFSLLAALLVLLSPAVLDFAIWQVGYGSEPLASALIGGAFLAVVARRDALCIALLALALLTKETALWAPFAAALTVLVRPNTGAEPRRHALVAAAMLLPLAMWLGLRVAFFGGIGSTYATAGYGSPVGFLSLAGSKLLHLHRLFINRETLVSERPWAAVDRALAIGVYSMLAVLLLLCARRGLRAAVGALRRVARERQWPTADRPSLAILWTAMGLALHFALALPDPRYAASTVLFAWPAMVGEIAGRRAPIVRLAWVACFVLSLARTSIFLADNLLPTDRPQATRDFEAIATMNAALRDVPAGIREIYVLSTGGLVPVNPDYLRAYLDVRARIIRIADVRWYCKDEERVVAVDRDLSGGVVTLSATVPDCGRFFFDFAGFAGDLPVGNRLRRNDSIDYELPAVPPRDRSRTAEQAPELGGRLMVHIRPRGPARFLIEHGRLDGGVAAFDMP